MQTHVHARRGRIKRTITDTRLFLLRPYGIDLRSYGLGAIYFGRDQFTHWVWTGARSIPELNTISEELLAHPAFAKFNSDVGNMRVVVNTSQIEVLKGWAKQ